MEQLENTRIHFSNLLSKFMKHKSDVGSAEYQIICLTYRILMLDLHCKQHKKDHPVHRRLQALVSKRKKFQAYLIKHKYSRYAELIADLGLRK